jgi:hypothetical protein
MLPQASGRAARRRAIPAPLLALAAVLALAPAGCLGPQAVKQTRLKYNEAFHRTSAEQILLNVVRLRYADTPTFLDLPNITSQFEAASNSGYSYGLNGEGPGRTNLGNFELLLRDSPTLSYQPKVGEAFGRSLARPLNVELIRLVLATTNLGPFLLMAVNDANDIPNAPEATALVPQVPDQNEEFRSLVDLFAALEQRYAIELAVETLEVEASDPLPTRNVRGQNLIDAARTGYVFRADDGDRVTLKKRQKVLALKVRPPGRDAPEMGEIARRLDIAPGLEIYPIRSELLDDEDDDEAFAAAPNPLGEDTIFLNMRSSLEIMTFLSKGVRVPPEHAASGEAPTVRDAAGCPYDWTLVTRDLFTVCSGTKRPPEGAAEVAVPYRGHWYWIDRRDTASRATLTFLELLLSLQETKEEDSGPLLTLPVGG